MSKEMVNRILMIAGTLMVVVSLAADVLGIGARPGFGYHQLAGVAAGLAAVAAGFWLSRAKTNKK